MDDKGRLKALIFENFRLAADSYDPGQDKPNEQYMYRGGQRTILNPDTFNSAASVTARQTAVVLIQANDRETLQGFIDYALDDESDNMQDAFPLHTPEDMNRELKREDATPEQRQKAAVLALNTLVNYRTRTPGGMS